MSYKSVKREINQILRKNHYYSRVAVEFLPTKENESSKIVYMTEPEIRAIQVLVMTRVKLSNWEVTKEWLSTFIIYDGPTKRGSKPMEWDENLPGRFVSKFKPGFYDMNGNLYIKLLL